MSRILYIDESRGIGGAEEYLRTVAIHFAGGNEVNLAHPGDEMHRDFYAGVVGTKFEFPVSTYHRTSHLIRDYYSLIRKVAPDVLHLNLPAPDFCRLAAIAGRLAGGPAIVATSHLPNLHFPRSLAGKLAGKGLWDQFAWRAVFSSLDRTIVVSRASRDSLLAHYPARSGKVTCVYNGIDCFRFQNVPDLERHRVRRELLIPVGSRVVTVIGGLLPQKGHGTLLDAFSGVSSKFKDVVLLVVGEGPLRSELEERAAKLGLREKVRFAGRRNDIPAILAVTDVYANSSRFEGLPFTILEAMASGVPVVATAVDGTVEVVSNGVTGLLAAPDDAESLTKALCRILEDEPLRRQLAVQGREQVSVRFSLEAMLQATGEVYRECLGKRRPYNRGVA